MSTRFGRIDIWINNAAMIQVGPLENLKLEDFEQIMNINFWGVVHGVRAVLPHMRERQSGHIVNINSVSGKISLPHLASYNAAKAAAYAFSETLGMELSNTGVLVTTVSPGPMRTGSYMAAEYAGDAQEELKWFGALTSFPIPAPIGPISSENAAQLIVRAIKRGSRQITIPVVPFDLISRLHGLLPEISLTIRTFIGNRLPAPSDESKKTEGKEMLSGLDESLVKTQMEAGARHGETLNQT